MAFCSRSSSKAKKSTTAATSSLSSISRRLQQPHQDQMGDPPGESGGAGGAAAVAANAVPAATTAASPPLSSSSSCLHKEVMKDLCVQCGQDIRRLTDEDRKTILKSASISMIHSIPELKISQDSAEQLGRADEERLLRDRKLILLVDLDQTIIHTTNDPSGDQYRSSGEFFHFQLDPGHQAPVYHTKTRPHCQQFLQHMARRFELHIVTFGSRMYAHEIARFLDPDRKFFSHRILSRDECISAHSKTANLKELFPCGDALVCIIDDREDVWNFAPNVVPVKPYQFFTNTGDINSPFKASEGNFFQQQAVAAAPPSPPSSTPVCEKVVITTSSDLSSSTSTNPPDTGHEDAAAATDAQSDNESERGQKRDEPGQGDDKLTSDKEGKEGDAGGQEEMADQTGKCVQEQVQEVKEGKETGGQECQVTIIPDSKAKTTPGKKEGRDGEEERNETVGECKLTTPVGGESKPGDKVKEEKDMDVYLIQLEGILKKIHQKFYQEFDEKQRYRDEGEVIKVPDLKDIIPKIKKQVLHGCTIVFSGVIPTGVPTASSRIHRLATSLGAKVSDSVTVQRVDPCPSRTGMTPAAMFAPQERTTHVVASKFGTVKVRSAQKDPRIKVVNPLWLYACAENWERVSEDGYLLREEDDFQSHPLVAAEKKLLSSRDPAAAGHSFRTSSSSSPPSASPPGTSKEVEVTASEDPGDGLMEHPLNQLSMFSSRELQCMDKEVEDACSEGDDMDDSSDEDDKRAPNVTLKRMRESSSEDSMDGECPKGWQSERRKKQSISPSPEEEEDQGTVDSDVAFGPAGGFISESSSSDSPGGSGSSGSLDGAADLLEREFLS